MRRLEEYTSKGYAIRVDYDLNNFLKPFTRGDVHRILRIPEDDDCDADDLDDGAPGQITAPHA